MSKEKQCECCHEWWFGGDVKEDLCPNCYDYFKQLKQQLAESFTEEDVEGLIEDREKTIKFLQKELAEKQNTIDEINREFVQAVHDWKALCKKKDKEIEMLKHTLNLYNLRHKGSVLPNVNQLAIQKLEEVKVNLKDRISMMKNEEHSYLQKVVAWYDICDQINQQIKELKGQDND